MHAGLLQCLSHRIGAFVLGELRPELFYNFGRQWIDPSQQVQDGANLLRIGV